MSLNHLNSIFGTESFRRYLQNYLVKDIKVDPFKMVILCMQSAQTLEIVSRSQFSAVNTVIAKKTFKCFENCFVYKG